MHTFKTMQNPALLGKFLALASSFLHISMGFLSLKCMSKEWKQNWLGKHKIFENTNKNNIANFAHLRLGPTH